MFLLDTNVVSELRKVCSGRADAHVAAWTDQIDTRLLLLPVVRVEELELDVRLTGRKDPRQGELLRTWLLRQVLTAFERCILPIDTEIALRIAGLHSPEQRPIRDALIAATVPEHGLTVATGNIANFAPTQVEVFDSWQL